MQNPIARFVPQLGGEYPKSFLDLYNRIPRAWSGKHMNSAVIIMKDKNGSLGNRILNIALR
jgi:hypothetical protein